MDDDIHGTPYVPFDDSEVSSEALESAQNTGTPILAPILLLYKPSWTEGPTKDDEPEIGLL